MVYEVDSLDVARGIEYVFTRDTYREPDYVILIPDEDLPLPRLNHHEYWIKVDRFEFVDCPEETVQRYKELNAIAIAVDDSKIISILDLSGNGILYIKDTYQEAIRYLEYVLTLSRTGLKG